MATHKGSCHCGRIAFMLEGDITEAMECNCSLCARRGALLHFAPASTFTLTTPRENLSTYRFNKHVIDHHFCAVCGVSPFSEGEHPKGGKIAAVNLRCVEGIDPKALIIKFHDGRRD
ncbi:MAG TPA: GFA family protein [Rhizomicrobium sp.]